VKRPRKGSIADTCQRVARVVEPVMLLARAAVDAELTCAQVTELLRAAMDREIRERKANRASKA